MKSNFDDYPEEPPLPVDIAYSTLTPSGIRYTVAKTVREDVHATHYAVVGRSGRTQSYLANRDEC